MLKDQQIVCLFNGARIAYPPGDRVAQYLYEGWFEANEMAFVVQCLAEGDVFLDLGAHAGLYSVLAKTRIGKTGRIIACDPNPAILPWLEQNLGISANLKPHPLAPGEHMIVSQGVADQSGSADFYLGDEHSSAYASLHENEFAQKKTTIELTTLDALVAAAQLEHIDFIKVDIEGAEARFLDGARNTINANPNIMIMMEVTESNQQQFGESTQSLFDKVANHRLKLFDVNIIDQKVSIVEADAPLWHKNLILAKDQKTIENRLHQASEPIKIQSIDKAKQGQASHKLYEDSQSLQKLLRRLGEPVKNLAQIGQGLSAGSRDLRALETRVDDINTDPLPADARVEIMSSMIDDEIGRLRGIADSVLDRISLLKENELNLAERVSRLAEALRPLGDICDKLNGGDDHSRRFQDFLNENQGYAPAHQIQSTEDFLVDKIGRLAGISDTVVSRMDAEITAREDDGVFFGETITMLNDITRRQIVKIEAAENTLSYLQAAREEIRQMGVLIFELRRSRISIIAQKLRLPSARVVNQLAAVYCGGENQEGD